MVILKISGGITIYGDPAHFFAIIRDNPGSRLRNDEFPSSSSVTFSICPGDALGEAETFLGDTRSRCIEISPSDSIKDCSRATASGDDRAGFDPFAGEYQRPGGWGVGATTLAFGRVGVETCDTFTRTGSGVMSNLADRLWFGETVRLDVSLDLEISLFASRYSVVFCDIAVSRIDDLSLLVTSPRDTDFEGERNNDA